MSGDMIAENIGQVRATVAESCMKAGRFVDSVTLVAVSKQKPIEDIIAAAQAGILDFGENRPEELERKRDAVVAQISTPIQWHMIGHVQSRKAKMIPALFDVLQSVDSLKLAQKISELALATGKAPFPVLVEVNVSGEETKGGFEAVGWEYQPDVVESFAESLREISALPGLRLRGLMTLAPYVDEMELTRPVFASLFALRGRLQDYLGFSLPDLSMGMTNDYPVAIEEGATIIRVGRAIFGERPLKD